MIAIYFLFINDESQVPKNVQERDNVYIKEYGNRKVFAIDPAEKNENKAGTHRTDTHNPSSLL